MALRWVGRMGGWMADCGTERIAATRVGLRDDCMAE